MSSIQRFCWVIFACVTVLVWPLAGRASAGGSWLYPLEDRYDPGDQAILEGSFGRGQLGWLEDGPFYAYLRVDPAAVEASAPEAWPYVDPTDLPLGEIVLVGGSGGWLNATLTFTVPEVEPGLYEVTYCNDPCTSGIGDLIGATISIGEDPDRPLIEASRRAAFNETLVDGVGDAQAQSAEVRDEPIPEAEHETDVAVVGVSSLDDRAGDGLALASPPPEGGLGLGWLWALGLGAFAAFGIVAMMGLRRGGLSSVRPSTGSSE